MTSRKILAGLPGALSIVIGWTVVVLAILGNVGLLAAVVRYIETSGAVNVIDVTPPCLVVACMAASLVVTITVGYALIRSTLRNSD